MTILRLAHLDVESLVMDGRVPSLSVINVVRRIVFLGPWGKGKSPKTPQTFMVTIIWLTESFSQKHALSKTKKREFLFLFYLY